MGILFDGVADVERFACLDVVEVTAHVEGDAVHDILGLAIDQLQFHVFVFLAHEPARAIVGHVPGAENGLLVTGSEGVELLEQREELGGDFVEVVFTSITLLLM